jgi:hypothetical protein
MDDKTSSFWIADGRSSRLTGKVSATEFRVLVDPDGVIDDDGKRFSGESKAVLQCVSISFGVFDCIDCMGLVRSSFGAMKERSEQEVSKENKVCET